MKRFAALMLSFGIAMLMLVAIVAQVHAQDVPTPTAEGAVIVAPEPTAEATAVVTPAPTPIPAPAPGDTVDPAQLALGLVLAFMVGLERFVNMLKPFIQSVADKFNLDDKGYSALVTLVSVALGIFGVLASNQQLNILIGFPLIPPLLGIIITGAAAGGGAAFVHSLFDFANGYKQVQNAKVLTAYATTPANVYVPKVQEWPKPSEVK